MSSEVWNAEGKSDVELVAEYKQYKKSCEETQRRMTLIKNRLAQLEQDDPRKSKFSSHSEVSSPDLPFRGAVFYIFPELSTDSSVGTFFWPFEISLQQMNKNV